MMISISTILISCSTIFLILTVIKGFFISANLDKALALLKRKVINDYSTKSIDKMYLYEWFEDKYPFDERCNNAFKWTFDQQYPGIREWLERV